jgi:hypothetical protein
LVNPQHQSAAAIGSLTYNQLLDLIILSRPSSIDLDSPPDQHQEQQALLVQEWLDESQSQLTYHGLCELHALLAPNDLGVCFRNNHFSVLFKQQDSLFLLVTDKGFSETSAMWETLRNVDGDSEFLDGNFQPLAHWEGGAVQGARGGAEQGAVYQHNPSDIPRSPDSQEQVDISRALSLSRQDCNPGQHQQTVGPVPPPQSDVEYARMVQAEEHSQYNRHHRGGGGRERGGNQPPPDVIASQHEGSSSRRKRGDCRVM